MEYPFALSFFLFYRKLEGFATQRNTTQGLHSSFDGISIHRQFLLSFNASLKESQLNPIRLKEYIAVSIEYPIGISFFPSNDEQTMQG
jgi:hypothetical protein